MPFYNKILHTINPSNKKAISFFKEKGCTLSLFSADYYICCKKCRTNIHTKALILVEGDYVNKLSGTKFHKVLVDNNLL